MKNTENAEPFYHSLAIAGETGTLEEIFTAAPLRGNIKAKTGSMKRVASLTGYVTNISGDDIAFSLIVNNYDGNVSKLKVTEAIEKLLVALVNEP